MVERDLQPFEDVRAGLGLRQLELDPSPHDLAAELDEVLDYLEQRQHLRASADDREQRDAVAHLELRVLVEVVEHDVGQLTALELDDNPHAFAARLVAQVGDPVDPLVPDQLGDVLDERLLVHLIRDLGDDNRDPIAALLLLERRLAADDDAAAALDVGFVHAGAADDRAARRKVGSRHGQEQRPPPLFDRRAPPLDHGQHAVDDLTHVVRRNARRHSHGNAGRSVDEQVRKRRREDGRLLGCLVEVRTEIDRVLVEVRHHRLGQRLETGLGVAVGRRRIAVDRAEVPLPVDERVAHVEVLRQPDQRVVRGRVAVRMVVADDLADDLGALAIRAVRREPHLPHREQHAPVRRLQPVPNVRQRPPDDYAHRVIHVRALHLVFDVDGDEGGKAAVVHRSGFRGSGFWVLGFQGSAVLGCDGPFGFGTPETRLRTPEPSDVQILRHPARCPR